MAESNTNEVEVNDNEFPVDDALKFLEGTAPFITENDMAVHVYSNEIYNPVPYGLLDILYRQTFENRVGIMIAKHAETGDLVPIICFVGDKDGEDVALYPIARMLKEDETQDYLAPLGNGEYFSYDQPDAAE